ncbi:methyl-accepting chemotaxis protein [Aestuariivirga sp.]|uniref:methyl-accepting chemotaxis protein n=1 Tax=Aestuariivirga sp. TaxID=2650926 RepID=UPI0039E57C1F
MSATTVHGQGRSLAKSALSISRLMTLSAIAVIITVAAFAIYSSTSFLEHRVGGDRFRAIENGAALIADYIPPPLLPYEALTLVNATLASSNPDIKAAISKWRELQKSFDDRMRYWEAEMEARPFLDLAKWKPFHDGFVSHGQIFWTDLNKEIIPALQAGDRQKAREVSDKLTTEFVEFQKFVQDNQSFISDQLAVDEKESLAASSLALQVGYVLAGALCVGLAALFLLGNRHVVRALTRISEVMSKLANGDLTVSIPYEARRDEVGEMARAVSVFKAQAQENFTVKEANEYVIGKLGEGLQRLSRGDLTQKITDPFPESLDPLRISFNEMVDALQVIIANVRAGADGISSGTSEISHASDDLSRRTENQAANLEQTAAALAEITSKVRDTAAGASHARSIVALAKSDADKSGMVVDRAISAMKAIETSSQRISQIVGLVDDMAFQTNLLALNAGVEAARAGDVGRGFSVVASEVRALAQRSAEAAKDIREHLSTAQDAVEEGVQLVAETGTSLRSIIERIADINQVVTEIAASAEHQASGLQEVNTAVEQMDMVTQQNAAMVEETTAATRTLTEQSGELARIVARFRLAGQAGSTGSGGMGRAA